VSTRISFRVVAYCAAMFAMLAIGSSAFARPADSPLGTWLTESGHGVVAIAACGDALCGRIVGIDRDPGSLMPTDVNGRPQCDLTIITDAKPEADGTWLGAITDPRNGDTYRAKLWVDDNGNLHLRGFIGISLFGSTQIWRPFTGHLGAECGLA
jgi:uncharacterized protein (DUF2147 family)